MRLLIIMSRREEEVQYVTVRIPKFYDDLINLYIGEHWEEMRLQGLRASRAGIIKKALYEFFKREGLIPKN